MLYALIQCIMNTCTTTLTRIDDVADVETFEEASGQEILPKSTSCRVHDVHDCAHVGECH